MIICQIQNMGTDLKLQHVMLSMGTSAGFVVHFFWYFWSVTVSLGLAQSGRACVLSPCSSVLAGSQDAA